MKWIDTSVAVGLQQRLHNDEPRVLTLLYLELRRMAVLILKDLRASPEKIDSYSHDAASWIIERYMKNPCYHIKSFSEVMRRSCLDAMHERYLNPSSGYRDRPKTQAHTAWVDLDRIQIASQVNDEVIEDDPALIDGLFSYFRHFQWYRPAIKGLMPYLSRRWMFDHSKQLKQIFLESRNGKDTNQRPHRRRGKEAGSGDHKEVQASLGSASKLV